MANRIGPGPVFVFESRILARRWHGYAGRALFITAILVGLAVTWWANVEIWSAARAGITAGKLAALASAGEQFFYAFAGIQITIVFLVAPAATAGAICQDRAQGILTQLAMTDLSSAEIVLGKLASRLAPVLGLLVCALPVLALATLLGGIDPLAVFGLFAVSVAVAVLGCALALAFSLWVDKTHEAIMAVVLLWIAWLISLPTWAGYARSGFVSLPPEWFRKANPILLIYSPYLWPNYVGVWDVVLFVAGAFLLSAFLAGLTIAFLRRSVRNAGAKSARKTVLHTILDFKPLAWLERLPGPSLDGNPVLWREWHRNRPSRLARLLWAIYGLAAITGTAWGICEAFRYGVDTSGGGSSLLYGTVVLQFLFGLLLLAAQAPSSLAEERIRNNLDVLLTTPLSTREIVWGKWLGTYRTVFFMTILPALGAVVVAWLAPPMARSFTTAAARGRIPTVALTTFDRVAGPGLLVWELLSYGAAITSVGLALATWIRRFGRAVAINMIVFAFFGIGWPVMSLIAWRVAQLRLWEGGIPQYAVEWISDGLLVASPFGAPQVTMFALVYYHGTHRAPLWCFAFAWTVLAWALAGLAYWAICETFDRNLGRIPDFNRSDAPEPGESNAG
jgi:ABC-type transport system involved in multi-copper enzyme maturation permease subunit